MIKKIAGFTLIEMLVTISIIGILAALALVSFTSSQKQARDTQRKSDLKQYQSSLEAYANKNNGLYPERNVTVTAQSTLCLDLGLTNCPADPKEGIGSFGYRYQSDGSASTGNANATKYVVWGAVENATGLWVLCSDGKVGISTLTPTGGSCPI